MTPSELRALLEPFGIRPLKDRSQHFLLDGTVVVAMADAAGLSSVASAKEGLSPEALAKGEGMRVLEIGPGPGILTEELLRRGASVVAVEIDKKLCALLRARFGASKDFHLLEGDALAFSNADLDTVFARPEAEAIPRTERTGSLRPQWRPRNDSDKDASGPSLTKVVANLPYAITSAILRKFLLGRPAPATITVMVQKEVADRILAKPGDMSSLAVLVQTLARSRRVRNVPPGAFFPPPKVASAVIHMELLSEAELDAFFGSVPPERYFEIVRRAFSGRRKQLKNTLKAVMRDPRILEKAFVEAKISPSARPEELSVQQWIALCRALVRQRISP